LDVDFVSLLQHKRRLKNATFLTGIESNKRLNIVGTGNQITPIFCAMGDRQVAPPIYRLFKLFNFASLIDPPAIFIGIAVITALAAAP
jgi:hypothetical protein